MPVTLFVYDSGAFAEGAKQDKDSNETNVRVKVGSLDLVVPETTAPLSQGSTDDPFRTFYLSAYLSKRQGSTITGSASSDGTQDSEGEHVWFVGNIGAGHQLLAAVCDRQCIEWQGPRVEMPQFRQTLKPQTRTRAVNKTTWSLSRIIVDILDFAGESLVFRDAATGQQFSFNSLEEGTADMSVQQRAIIASYLYSLGGAETSIALDELSNAGLVDAELEDWEFEGYERRHVVTMRPARPKHLTAVRLKLSEPARWSILEMRPESRNCTC